MDFHPDSIQSYIEPAPWWIKTDSKSVKRGFLLKAFLPHVDQVPYQVVEKGRSNARSHDRAYIRIKPLDMKNPKTKGDLPVAAMSLHQGEIWAAYRAKKRPCLVLAKDGSQVDQADRKGMPKRNTAQTLLVAPYYGADQDGTRAGYNPQFVERVRHTVYPRFFMDMLPLGGPKESLLRLDQMHPIGRISNSYELTGFQLSYEALEVIDEIFHLYMHGEMHEGADLYEYQNLIKMMYYE